MPFREVIGHRRIVDLLSRSVARDSLPPSLIFAGPAGVGKRLTATALAQALNCTAQSAVGSRQSAVGSRQSAVGSRQSAVGSPQSAVRSQQSAVGSQQSAVRSQQSTVARRTPVGTADRGLLTADYEGDACGTCSACTRIARGVHPDVLVLEPGDNGSIKIEQVRDAVDRTGYRPFEGKRRVAIIDEADALVPAAQNALLKTLEEPPSLSVFILVTARPDVLLPTVRSRCPRLGFRPLSPNEIAGALMARGQSETSARAVAAAADGSLGRALQANTGDLVHAREVAQQVLTHAASTPDPQRRIEGAKGLLANTGGGGASDREQLASHLRAMASLLRDIELLSTGSDAGALANRDIGPTLDRLTPAYQGGRGIRAFAAVDRALVALERNAGVKIVADWLVLEL